MQAVSQEFIDKIKARERKIFSKVQIDYSDPFIDQSIKIDVNDNNYTSYPHQVADNIQESCGKIICLDGNWALGNKDKDWVLAPGKDEIDKYQMGWWGNKLSNSDGTFNPPYPTLTTTFFSRPIRSLKVIGENKRKEWSVDFNIKLYNELGEVLYTETVTNNNLILWKKDINPINEVTKMELEITKWSKANKCVKILEFFTSIQETYEGDDILFIHLLEEREVSQGSLPVGNISSNEIDIRLSNEDGKFDVGNKQSFIYNLLKANRRIKIWLGVEKNNGEKEWVPLGVFWSNDWNVPESEIYASVTGRDKLEQLRKTTYSNSQVQINKTLYDLATIILKDSGLKDIEYWIDEELKQFVVPYSYFEPQSHREALRKISEACMGQVYCDREGIIRIEGPSFTLNRISKIQTTSFLQSEYPTQIKIINAIGISDDDYFAKDNPSRQSQIANIVEVETQPLRPDVLQEIYKSNEPANITAGGIKTITIFFNESPCIDVSINIEGTGTIESVDIYAWGANVKVSSSINGNFTIIAKGKPLKIMNKDKAIARDETSIIDNGEIRYEYPNNPLVQTLDIAETIAKKLLQYYKDPRRDLEMDWRGNPALELGDVIVTFDYLTENTEERGYYYITKQELEYARYLRASLEGRRAL